MNDGESRRDPMAPPEEPCECWCIECGRTFMSDQMWLQRIIEHPRGMEGFWMCPTPNCGGAGFTFDIFPTDPDHPANEGWHFCDDDEEEAGDDWQPDEDEDGWDPAETTYADMDEELAAEGDIEGEEWKHPSDLQPPAESPAQAEARRAREEHERKYDEPDTRPREVYYKDLHPGDGRSSFSDDDIPF